MSGPGPSEPTDTVTFSSADGTELYGEWFECQDDEPRGIALIIHGYAEHCGRYREVARVATDLGHHVFSFDLRGHGRSAGQRGHIERFAEYLDDTRAALDQLRAKAGALPLLVVAHSMGSLVALRLFADQAHTPDDAYGLVVSSPFLGLALEVPAAKVLLGRIASRVLPSLSLPNELKLEALTSDKVRQQERRVDTLCHDVASARWFTEAVKTQKWVLQSADQITVPTQWLVAGSDQIADPASSRAVSDRMRGDCRYHEYPAMQHEVFNETDRETAFELLADFVNDVFPRRS